jgi:hypothetical protein
MVTFITVAKAVARSRAEWSNRTVAESAIRKSAGTAMDTRFDIFLSHSYEDAEVIAGIKGMIEDQDLSVYVDWIEDSQADRNQVTTATADMLRQRMNHSRFLLYASSKASVASKWMPWELGYFDGLRNDHVGIVPIVQSEDATFRGQEYLGLYPYWELFNFRGIGEYLGRQLDASAGIRLRTVVR